MSKVTAEQLADTLERRLGRALPRCEASAFRCTGERGELRVCAVAGHGDAEYVQTCPAEAEAVAAMEQRVIAAVTALGWH